MLNLGSPYTKDDILAAFSAEHNVIYHFFHNIPEDQFFSAPPDIWTPAENLMHLTLSSKPIVLALRLPKLVLRLRFGKAKHKSTSVAAVRTEYVYGALTGGGVAPGPYLPNIHKETPAEKQRILAKWQAGGRTLEQALSRWSEESLDDLIVPHPLIGDLTIREILFFTLYHNLHHVRDVQQTLGLPQDEWFDPAFTKKG